MSRTKTLPAPFPNARLKPPSTLSKGAAAVFRQIVRSVAHDHFSEVDTVLIAEYACACDMANQAHTRLTLEGAVVDGKASPWLAVQREAQRSIVALCARLRVSPQSRFDRLKAGTTSRPQARPWHPADGRKRGLASFRSE